MDSNFAILYAGEAMTDERYYCTMWAKANHWFERWVREAPLFELTPETMASLTNKALILAATKGMGPAGFSCYADMVNPEVFAMIVLEARKRLTDFEAAQIEYVLLALARDWVGVPLETINMMISLISTQPASNSARKLAPHAGARLRRRRATAGTVLNVTASPKRRDD